MVVRCSTTLKVKESPHQKAKLWLQWGVLKTAVLRMVLEPVEKLWRRAYPVCFMMPRGEEGGRRNKRPARCWAKSWYENTGSLSKALSNTDFSPCIGAALVSFGFGVLKLFSPEVLLSNKKWSKNLDFWCSSNQCLQIVFHFFSSPNAVERCVDKASEALSGLWRIKDQLVVPAMRPHRAKRQHIDQVAAPPIE